VTGDEPLARLAGQGVSIWLDAISRNRLASGGLARLIEGMHVTGVTSNPTIFAQAIRTGGRNGRVSIEVDPRAAGDTAKTGAEARALRWLVARPGVVIKIPATKAGLAAITQATAEGISVNVTLIFGLDRYEQATDAYLTGLERAATAGLDLSVIHSVASFFVSRVDTETDARLNAVAGHGQIEGGFVTGAYDDAARHVRPARRRRRLPRRRQPARARGRQKVHGCVDPAAGTPGTFPDRVPVRGNAMTGQL
jgi:transaldolase